MIMGAMNDCGDVSMISAFNYSYRNQVGSSVSLCGPPPVLGVDAAESDAVHWVMSPEENPRRRNVHIQQDRTEAL